MLALRYSHLLQSSAVAIPGSSFGCAGASDFPRERARRALTQLLEHAHVPGGIRSQLARVKASHDPSSVSGTAAVSFAVAQLSALLLDDAAGTGETGYKRDAGDGCAGASALREAPRRCAWGVAALGTEV